MSADRIYIIALIVFALFQAKRSASIEDWLTTSRNLLIAIVAVVGITLAVVGLLAREFSSHFRDTAWIASFPWQAVAGLVTAEGVLITFLFSRAQSQKQFDEKIVHERYVFDEKQKADRQAFEIKSQNELFEQIIDHYSSDNLAIRANAAFDLAEIAQKPETEKINDRIQQTYPYYPRSSSQIAVALHLEPNSTVRNQILKAIGRLAFFGAGKGQLLLHQLIRELADANRSALESYIFALARNTIDTDDLSLKDQLDQLSELVPLCDSDNSVRQLPRACLESLVTSEAFRRARRYSQIPSSAMEVKAQLTEYISAVNILRDTSTALVSALYWLREPEDFREFKLKVQDFRLEEAKYYKRSNPLDLSGTFLAGVTFNLTNLQGANLADTYLHGVTLADSNLQYAKFVRAHLQGAMLDASDFTRGSLSGAELQGASLANTILTKSSLIKANAGADESEATYFGKADFSHANWKEANTDSELKSWLAIWFDYDEADISD